MMVEAQLNALLDVPIHRCSAESDVMPLICRLLVFMYVADDLTLELFVKWMKAKKMQ